jgi:hypothetical protein
LHCNKQTNKQTNKGKPVDKNKVKKQARKRIKGRGGADKVAEEPKEESEMIYLNQSCGYNRAHIS